MAEWDEGDEALAASIFGVRERLAVVDRLEAWLRHRGFSGARITSLEISVGAAAGVSLGDGSTLFAKVWSPDSDADALAAQLHVQGVMAGRDFPAPSLRSGLEQVGDAFIVLMEFNRSGDPTDVRQPGVTEAMARGLAAFLKAADGLDTTPDLPSRMPPTLWPKPHNVLFDFEATIAGAEWIDGVARSALDILAEADEKPIVGHLDWSAKNMRIGPSELAVVYDWDSVFLAGEGFILGSAAASFPTTWELPVDPIPSPGQISEFIAAYEIARGQPLGERCRAAAHASIRYGHAYSARCLHAVDPLEAKRRWEKVLLSPA